MIQSMLCVNSADVHRPQWALDLKKISQSGTKTKEVCVCLCVKEKKDVSPQHADPGWAGVTWLIGSRLFVWQFIYLCKSKLRRAGGTQESVYTQNALSENLWERDTKQTPITSTFPYCPHKMYIYNDHNLGEVMPETVKTQNPPKTIALKTISSAGMCLVMCDFSSFCSSGDGTSENEAKNMSRMTHFFLPSACGISSSATLPARSAPQK